MVCPPGKKGSGGLCQCKSTDAWTEEGWEEVEKWTCEEGVCYMRQSKSFNTDCTGKPDGHQFNDGTWCWSEKRSLTCPTTPGD